MIATAEQAMEIEKLKKGAHLKLVNDITVPDEIYMSGKKFVFDLNGHTVKLEYAEGVKPNNGSVLYIGGKGSSLTINDSSEAQPGDHPALPALRVPPVSLYLQLCPQAQRLP